MIKEIKFTDKAIKQINHLLNQKNSGTFFRIAILGGGCSGFKYEFSFDTRPEKEDIKFNKIRVYITDFYRNICELIPRKISIY